MAHDGTGTGWDETAPANGDPFKDGAKEIRDLRKALRIRLEYEHEDMGSSSTGGEHLAGSAKGYVDDDPATNITQRPDGSTTLDADDTGRFAVDTTDGFTLQYWDGSAWVDIVVPLLSVTAGMLEDTLDISEKTITLPDSQTLTTPTIADFTNATHDHADAEGGGLIHAPYAKYWDTKAAGTDGGGFTKDTWVKRDITAEVTDAAEFGELDSNEITLEAGTYYCRIRVPGHICGNHKAKLTKSNGNLLLNGSTARTSNSYGIQTNSWIVGEFTLASQTAVMVLHRCTDTRNTDGLGQAGDIDSLAEIYTELEFWKVA